MRYLFASNFDYYGKAHLTSECAVASDNVKIRQLDDERNTEVIALI